MKELENVSLEQYVSDVLAQIRSAASKNLSKDKVKVDFELSVVATNETSSNTRAGFGLVSVLNLGAIGTSTKENELKTTNRIKFSISIQ